MSWWSYVERIIGDDNQKTVAAKIGVDQATVSRWKVADTPGKAENVIQLARGYGRPVLEAMVAAGFLTEAEAKVRPAAAPSLNSLSDDELVGEIRRRMKRGGGGDERDAAPMKLDLVHGEGQDEEPAQRAARSTGREPASKRHRAHLDQLGEDNQDPGDIDPA